VSRLVLWMNLLIFLFLLAVIFYVCMGKESTDTINTWSMTPKRPESTGMGVFWDRLTEVGR
jgi:hypothetical protein